MGGLILSGDFLPNGGSGASEGGTVGRGIPRSTKCTGWRARSDLRSTGRSKKPMLAASWRHELGQNASAISSRTANRERKMLMPLGGELIDAWIRLLFVRVPSRVRPRDRKQYRVHCLWQSPVPCTDGCFATRSMYRYSIVGSPWDRETACGEQRRACDRDFDTSNFVIFHFFIFPLSRNYSTLPPPPQQVMSATENPEWYAIFQNRIFIGNIIVSALAVALHCTCISLSVQCTCHEKLRALACMVSALENFFL